MIARITTLNIKSAAFAILIMSMAAVFILSSETTAQSSLRPKGKIAFTSDRDGNKEIYLMNADGTGQTRLTSNTIVDDHPIWSPNRNKLAFVSQRQTGGFAIFQINIDGTNRVEVTPLSQFVDVPPTGTVPFSMSWSPDGKKIAFQDPYYNDIWVVDVETHARKNLTNDGGGTIGLYDHNPAWSPDGTTILYASPRYNGICAALYAINPDGTNRRLVVPCQAYSPSWSPDGSKIVFVNLVEEFSSELHIANSDGTNVQTFDGGYPDPNYRDNPRWSPDRRKIAFSMRGPAPNYDIEIYVKNIDGTGFAQLTDTPAGRNYRPSWEPLAFDFDGSASISDEEMPEQN